MLTPWEADLIRDGLAVASQAGHPVADALALVARETAVAAGAAADPSLRLSSREEEVLALLIRGYNAHECAAQIGVQKKTVDTHRGQLLGKLGLRDVLALGYWALQRGLIRTDELAAVWSRPRRGSTVIDPASADLTAEGVP